MNIAELNTSGFEFNSTINLNQLFKQNLINRMSVKYTYLNSDYDSKTNSTSRYLLKYLKHQAILSINHNLILGISADWYFRYEERYNFGNNLITDLGINKAFNNFNVFVKATNLFGVDYLDFIGVSLPGRWVTGGVRLRFEEL